MKFTPNGWRTGRFEEFVYLQRGFDLTKANARPGDVPVISSSGISYYHDTAMVDPPGLVTGRKGSLGKVWFVDVPYWPHDTTLWVKHFRDNDPFFVKAFLERLDLASFDAATSVPTLNRNNLHGLRISFPPLPEQKKIAAILSTWDRAIELTEKLIAAKQKRKQALMQQLFSGQVRFGTAKDSTFVIHQGFFERKLGPLPSDWQVVKLPTQFWFQEGPGVQTSQFTSSGVKLFNGSNIQDAAITLENTTRHISAEEANGRYAHFLAEAGDLVIASSGIAVDKFEQKIAFLKKEHLPLCMNTSTIRFKSISTDAEIRYLRFFMMTSFFKNQIRRQITGSAQLNFGPTHLEKCLIALPPLDEQQQICDCLTAVEEETNFLRMKVRRFSEQKKGLMQKLLTGKVRVKVDAETEQV